MRLEPRDWERTTVGDLCSFSSGTGFGPSDWAKSGLPIIRIQNLNGSQDFNYYAGAPNPSWIVEPGELLFAWAGVKGVSFGPTIWRGPRGLLNQHIYRILPATQIELDWLYLQLQHVTALIEASAHGFKSSLVHVRKSDITGQVCFLPPIEEQRAIARVVTTWECGIRQLSDLIAAKLRFKQGLMQQLLTGKRRFPQFTDDWQHVRVGDIASEQSERNNGGNSILVLSCTKHDGLVDSLAYFGKRVFSDDTSNYKVVRRGDFAYATNHIEEGSIGLLSHADAGLVSPMYTVFRTNQGVVPEFLFRLLKTECYRQVFESFTSASVNRRGSLRWKQFSTIPLKLPSVAEQNRIDEALAVFDREIELLREQLDTLKSQKKGLMQKLLTGQVRVNHLRDVAKMAEGAH